MSKRLVAALLLTAVTGACGGDPGTVGSGPEPADTTNSEVPTPDATPTDPLAAPVLTVRSGSAVADVAAYTFCVSGSDPAASPGSGQMVGLCSDGFPTPTATPIALAADRELRLVLDRPWELEVSLTGLDDTGCPTDEEFALERREGDRWFVPETVPPGNYSLSVFADDGGDGAFAVLVAVGEPGVAGEAPPRDEDPPGVECL